MNNDDIYSAKQLEILRGSPVGECIRVPLKIARRWLINNQFLSCADGTGKVFYLGITNIGLGVCSVCKARLEQRETKMWTKKK